jgi:hypothetical protein
MLAVMMTLLFNDSFRVTMLILSMCFGLCSTYVHSVVQKPCERMHDVAGFDMRLRDAMHAYTLRLVGAHIPLAAWGQSNI